MKCKNKNKLLKVNNFANFKKKFVKDFKSKKKYELVKCT